MPCRIACGLSTQIRFGRFKVSYPDSLRNFSLNSLETTVFELQSTRLSLCVTWSVPIAISALSGWINPSCTQVEKKNNNKVLFEADGLWKQPESSEAGVISIIGEKPCKESLRLSDTITDWIERLHWCQSSAVVGHKWIMYKQSLELVSDFMATENEERNLGGRRNELDWRKVCVHGSLLSSVQFWGRKNTNVSLKDDA